MYEKACNNIDCNVFDPNIQNCCVTDSECKSTVLGCEGYKDAGYLICEENPGVPQCKNPCATIIDIPKADDLWQAEICEFFCPNYIVQDFWFGDGEGEDGDYEDPLPNGETRPPTSNNNSYKSRICSEEYYNLCRLAGCTPAETCKQEWAERQDNPNEFIRDYPTQYPIVYEK